MNWLRTHDVVLKILCFAVAVMLWLYVVGSENPETTTEYKNVQVTLAGKEALLEKHNLTVLQGDDAAVTLRVKARMDTVYQIGSADNILVSADLSSITTAGEHQLLYKVTLPVSDAQIVGQSPAYIKVVTDKIVTTTVPIEATVNGTAPEGYLYGDYRLSPEYVMLEGPDNELSKVAAASITVDADRLTETTSWTMDYKLIDKNGNEVQSDLIVKGDKVVLVTLPVTMTKQVPLTVDLLPAPGIDPIYASAEITPSSVLITGEEDILDTVNQISLGSIPLSEVSEEAVFSLPILLPNGVKGIGNPGEAQVKVTLNGIQTREYTVNKIEIAPFGPGVSLHPVTESLTVSLTGHYSVLNLINAADITVHADFAGSEFVRENGTLPPGRYRLPADVRVAGNPAAAVTGAYTVAVEVERT